MITPIKTMTINQIMERKDDLLVSVDDIKEIAKNERNKGIDDSVEKIIEEFSYLPRFILEEIAEQLKSRTEL